MTTSPFAPLLAPRLSTRHSALPRPLITRYSLLVTNHSSPCSGGPRLGEEEEEQKPKNEPIFNLQPAPCTLQLTPGHRPPSHKRKYLDVRGKWRYSSVSRGVRIAVLFVPYALRVPGAAAPPAVRPL
jgi:hypothetical protein